MTRALAKPLLIATLTAQIALVGWLDYYSGYEVRIGALYALPVAFAAWNLGLVAGVVTAVTIAGVILWAELAGGKVYTEIWIPCANTASRLAIFLFVSLSVSYFRQTITAAQKRVQAFAGRLPICACCNRVDGGDGFWLDFPTFLRKNSEAEPEFRTCPVCVSEGKGIPPSTRSSQ